ncbi:MAG TPA: hypothetical protein VF072_00950 [Thermoleophilaceae bacterium]
MDLRQVFAARFASSSRDTVGRDGAARDSAASASAGSTGPAPNATSAARRSHLPAGHAPRRDRRRSDRRARAARGPGGRERIAGRAEAAALIDAPPESERALWATALYAGPRRGELRAMRWSDIDLAAEPALIHVRRTWHDTEGEVDVKTEAGHRTVPLTGRLRTLVIEHGLATRRGGDDLVFGRTATTRSRQRPSAPER